MSGSVISNRMSRSSCIANEAIFQDLAAEGSFQDILVKYPLCARISGAVEGASTSEMNLIGKQLSMCAWEHVCKGVGRGNSDSR